MQFSELNPTAGVLPVFLPKGDLDYFSGRVFGGVTPGDDLIPELFSHHAWQHPDQLIQSRNIDGGRILDYLVQGFSYRTADEYTTFRCRYTDQIQGHFGVDALEFIRQHFGSLPKSFRSWVRQRRLYAAADTFWGDDGFIYIPCLNGLSPKLDICGHSPYIMEFGPKDFFLRD